MKDILFIGIGFFISGWYLVTSTDVKRPTLLQDCFGMVGGALFLVGAALILGAAGWYFGGKI